jgi:hypothetical protein
MLFFLMIYCRIAHLGSHCFDLYSAGSISMFGHYWSAKLYFIATAQLNLVLDKGILALLFAMRTHGFILY